ncbi:PTS glucose transporter subunit IIA [Anaerotruncus massiliensis (ex Liu et al. 2021)]|uniref:PTS glucose transporter subunit IIA n=2 Tax=Anaerotruncus TaxID=244127 RepID=A0A498CNY5_9FIRM|nr:MULTISPECIES: PTS glucose transporter subunit IIA [Anaerotruncus]MBC3938057.1 PTS glucose transporter subunit IIA [Anaerotruncus massiliensis (ex Togo et al. 2019)]RLL13624.1 PTS glucose transporter subunit IIA [Anaerotruncus massiliensis (ex Liu et al. 2021)]
MLNFLKGKQLEIAAPLTGKVIPVTEVPDPVFAEKVLGDGIAVDPTEGAVYSPVDGTIFQIAHTFHAMGIESDDGLEILVHLGIDTVKLEGKGFQSFVEVGQKVKKGDKIMEMDIGFIREQGLSPMSPCIITNLDAIKSMTACPGPAEGGRTAAITYKK